MGDVDYRRNAPDRLGARGRRVKHCRERMQIIRFCVRGAGVSPQVAGQPGPLPLVRKRTGAATARRAVTAGHGAARASRVVVSRHVHRLPGERSQDWAGMPRSVRVGPSSVNGAPRPRCARTHLGAPLTPSIC